MCVINLQYICASTVWRTVSRFAWDNASSLWGLTGLLYVFSKYSFVTFYGIMSLHSTLQVPSYHRSCLPNILLITSIPCQHPSATRVSEQKTQQNFTLRHVYTGSDIRYQIISIQVPCIFHYFVQWSKNAHNYFINYHTATCFDIIVSSTDSLWSIPCQVTPVFQMQLSVIQFTIKMFHIGFMQTCLSSFTQVLWKLA